MTKVKMLILLVAILVTLPCMQVLAVSAALSGTSDVRAGDTVALTYSVSGGKISGASGELSYDTAHLALKEIKPLVVSSWKVEFNGNTFAIYDETLENPISGNQTLFSAVFEVKNPAEGTKLSVSVRDAVVSDGIADSKIGTVNWSAIVKAPLSGNNNLASLSTSNATLSPEFNNGITHYTANVPFDVSKLQLSAVPEDTNARISISNLSLKAEATTAVTVTVTAENGAKKAYIIQVTRAKDPNYIPSSDNALLSIQVAGYVLSPPFSADIGRYVVWLPYETEKVEVSATPADGKSTVEVRGGEVLEAGMDNEILIVCTAENGDVKTYCVVAKRAPPHAGDSAEGGSSITSAGSEESDYQEAQEPQGNGVALWLVIALCVLCMAAGVLTTIGLYHAKVLKKKV